MEKKVIVVFSKIVILGINVPKCVHIQYLCHTQRICFDINLKKFNHLIKNLTIGFQSIYVRK